MTNQPAPLGGRPTTLIVAVLCAAVFLGLALLSFTAPASRVATLKSDYLEKAHFTYRAYAPPGPVYRDGIVRTGDPIFLRLVQRVQIDIDYRLAGAVPREVAGVHDVVLRLTGPTGWSRTLRLAPRRRFTGNHAGRQVILDLSYVRSLIRRVEALTGAAAGGAYTLAVTPRFRISGSVEGRSLASEFRPALSFQLDSLQLRPGSGPGASENAEGGFSPSRRRSIATVGAAPNRLGVKGLGLPVRTVRRLALAGFVLALACALVAGLREHRRPRDGTARVHRRYGHLIVPIAGISHSPARPPIDVAGMDTLAKLADRSGRLILHHHHENVDTYVVDDEGTLYRYTLAAAHATSTASPAVAH